MNIIFPIFPANEDERKTLWKKCNKKPVFYITLSRFQHQQSVIVLTNQRNVFDYLQEKGFSCKFVSITISLINNNSNNSTFPFENTEVKNYLDSVSVLNNSDEFIFIDYHNVCITPQLINCAYKKYLSSKKTLLLSTIIEEDNPIQFEEYFQIIFMDYLVLLEDLPLDKFLSETQKRNICFSEIKILFSERVTKTFYFNWHLYGVDSYESMSGLYLKRSYGDHFRMIPIESCLEQFKTELNKDEFICYYEGPELARKIVFKEICDDYGCSNCLGVPVNSNVDLNIYFNADDKSFYMKKKFVKAENLLKIYQSDKKLSLKYEDKIYFIFEKNDDDPSSEYLKIDRYESKTNLNDINGFLIIMLGKDKDQPQYFTEPVSFENMTWDIDYNTGTKINLSTRNYFSGRQDFPEVFKPDNSIIIIKNNDRPFYDNFYDNFYECARFTAFELDSSTSVRIRNEVDLLRYEITKYDY